MNISFLGYIYTSVVESSTIAAIINSVTVVRDKIESVAVVNKLLVLLTLGLHAQRGLL